MAIERSKVQAPVLPKEATEVPAIGGEVIVRAMLLSDRMAIWDMSKARDGETAEQARVRGESRIVADTLARSVVLDDGEPLWSSKEWDEFAATNPSEALRLFNIANRLSGGDAEAIEKN